MKINKVKLVFLVIGIITLWNIRLFSSDVIMNDIGFTKGDTETYYEEEEVVEESVGATGETVKKYICKYVWKVTCTIICMGPDHQTYNDCHEECRRTLVNKSCRPYV